MVNLMTQVHQLHKTKENTSRPSIKVYVGPFQHMIIS